MTGEPADLFAVVSLAGAACWAFVTVREWRFRRRVRRNLRRFGMDV